MAEKQTARQPNRPVDEIDASSFAVPRRAPAPARREGALHVCPCCDSELVFPTDWAPADSGNWAVELRCPDCEWLGGGVFAQLVVDRFDEALDEGTQQLLTDLQLLSRANMEEQVENFVAALWAGDIQPVDF